MEDSMDLQTLTVEPSCSAFSFPPHRRRPLRSRTYRTLLQILSQCRSEFMPSHTRGDHDSVESRLVSEGNEACNHGQMYSTDVLAPNPNYKDGGDALVEETDIDKFKENSAYQDGCFDVKQLIIQELDSIKLVTGEDREAVQANSINFADFLLDDSTTGDVAVQVENGPKCTSSAPNFQVECFGSTGQLEFDKEFSICDFSEVLESCSGMDIVMESSKVGEGDKEHGSALEDNRPKESELLLRLKAMELEKLISDPGPVDSFSQGAGDEEIEEGEISGEAGVADELLIALSEDAVSQADKTTGGVHPPENNVDKDLFTCKDEESGRWSHDISDPSIINIARAVSDPMVAELRTSTTEVQDKHSRNDFHDSYVETDRFGPTASVLENLPPPGRDLQEIAAGNISAATAKDGDLSQKKRKKGPLTKERRAKKKRKEKIKRAEKNRKLGIKRLKLQPVLKPKTISYCRHYLQGRCHEGEKCKFSHDTVPLTKSKPCSYFARQSCMKGDDCPFDHELSKYPCNNYTSKGFCSRGSDCLFSHEVPIKQSSSMTPSVSKAELKPENRSMPEEKGFLMTSTVAQSHKLTSPLNNSNPSEDADNQGTSHQKLDATLRAGQNTSSKSTKELLGPVQAARQVPKGVNFLSHGGVSCGDLSKHKGVGLSARANDGVDIHKMTSKVPVSVDKNEKHVGEAPKRPRGINFLSFAQKSPLDDTSHKMSNSEKGKSVLRDFAEEKQSNSLMRSGDSIKVNGQISQNATDPAQTLIEVASRIPRMTESQLITNLAFDQISSGKLQNPIKMPSLSFDGSVIDPGANISCSLKTSIFSNTPSLVQNAVRSTLAFASKFEPSIKAGRFLHQ